jgi:hypothetical protein
MGKRKKIDPELLARWGRERADFRELMRLRGERLDAEERRDAVRRERLRRLSLGLLGR